MHRFPNTRTNERYAGGARTEIPNNGEVPRLGGGGWGHCVTPNGVPIAALTATADEVARGDIVEKLFGGAVGRFVLGFGRANIRLAVEMKRGWQRQLTGFVAAHAGESVIVYCLSRRKTEGTAAVIVVLLPNLY